MKDRKTIRPYFILILFVMLMFCLLMTGCGKMGENETALETSTSEPSAEAGITDEAAVDYIVSPKTKLYVYDINGKLYGNYTCHVSGTLSDGPSESDRQYEETLTVSAAEPCKLALEEGNYTICLTDLAKSQQSYTFTIRVVADGGDVLLKINTDFEAGSSSQGLSVDWLTSHWFYQGIQTVIAYRFYEDGVWECYYDYYLNGEKLVYDESGSYVIDGNQLTLYYPEGWSVTLTYLCKAETPEKTDWDCASFVPDDEYFLYEYDYEVNYEDMKAGIYDNASYLTENDEFFSNPIVEGGRMGTNAAAQETEAAAQETGNDIPSVATSGDPHDAEDAVEIYLQNRDVWMLTEELNYMFASCSYAFLDFDGDGILELMTNVTAGTMRSSSNKYYKIDVQKRTVYEIEQDSSMYDDEGSGSIDGGEPCLYRDKKSGKLYYLMGEFMNGGNGNYGGYDSFVSMEDGKLIAERLWGADTQQENVTYYYFSNGTSKVTVDQKTLDKYQAEFLSQYEKLNVTIKEGDAGEINVAQGNDLRTMLLELYQSFHY